MDKRKLKKEVIKQVKYLCFQVNKEDSRFNHKYAAKRWEKYGKDRLYITRTSGGRNETSLGYIDLENMDFSNLKVPAGTLYNGISDMEQKIEQL